MFQFSLKKFMIAFVLISIVIGMIVKSINSHRVFLRTIASKGGASCMGMDMSFSLDSYFDHEDRPVVFILTAHQDEPSLLTFNYRYHTRPIGGQLKVNGRQIHPKQFPLLFVNGPFGQTLEFVVSEQLQDHLLLIKSTKGAATLSDECSRFWRDQIEPRVFIVKGKQVKGQREGPWTFSLRPDLLYLQGEYVSGKRNGVWTSFYPNGQKRMERNYVNGKVAGAVRFFALDGRLLTEGEGLCYRYGPKGGVWTLNEIELPCPDFKVQLATDSSK